MKKKVYLFKSVHLFLTLVLVLSLVLHVQPAQARSANQPDSTNIQLPAGAAPYRMRLGTDGQPSFESLSSVVPQTAPVPGDAGWRKGFGLPGVEGNVSVLAVQGEWLYMGGHFHIAGSTKTHHIARYNLVSHLWGEMDMTGFIPQQDDQIRTIALTPTAIYFGGALAGGYSFDGNLIRWDVTTQTFTYPTVDQDSEGPALDASDEE